MSVEQPSDCNQNKAADALLREQFWMLSRQNPTIYLANIICATAIAIIYAQTAPAYVILPLYGLLVSLGIKRGLYWRNFAKRNSVPLEEMRKAVAPMPGLTALLFLTLSAWIIMLVQYGTDLQKSTAIAYLCMTTFLILTANAYLPVRANVILATGCLPALCWLVLQGTASHFAFALIYAVNITGTVISARGQYQMLLDTITLRLSAESSHKRAEAAKVKLAVVANTDPLTDLYNRRAFLDAINQRIRRHDTGFVLGLIDLDGFKPVNDIYGHAAGDQVLLVVAERLKAKIDGHGIAARLGGDEFAFILEGGAKTSDALRISQALMDSIGRPIALADGPIVTISSGCGLALHEDKTEKGNELLERADKALYQAKRSGRGTVSVYDGKMKAKLSRRILIEKRLSKAIEQETFSIAYQPIRSLKTGKISSYEALARWNDNELGQVSPAEFIPIAEQSGLITPLSQKLFKRALRDAANWPREIKLSFNVSPVQFLSPGFALHTLLNLSNDGFPPERLILEITETTLVSNTERARAAINHLNAAGIGIALDDFGTGYASFGYLEKLNFDKLKIDRSLVTSAQKDAKKRAILKAIIEMCRNLEIICVAEGIETGDQVEMLKSLGCEFGQGYLVGRPEPAQSRHTPIHATSR